MGNRICVVVLSLLFSGCIGPQTLQALAKDKASICIKADAFIYGKIFMCRSNHDGAVVGVDKDGNILIQHTPK